MNILGPSNIVSPEWAVDWAKSRGATLQFRYLAPLYWRLAPDRGVNPEVAYCQAAKETAFGRFGGVLDASFCNPCGLKTGAGGENGDPFAHQRFPTWEVGVQAHLDHLALYAGALGYPLGKHTPDPRHFEFLYGTAPTVLDLSGKWAGAGYGESLVDLYIVKMQTYSWVPPVPLRYATAADLAKLTGRVEFALDECLKLRSLNGETIGALDKLASIVDGQADAMLLHQQADKFRQDELAGRIEKVEAVLNATANSIKSWMGFAS